jgi:hypothetical protein
MYVLIIKFPFGATALRFLLVVGSTAVLLVAGMLIVRPLFYKMASTPFEYLKKSVKPRPNVLRKRRWAAVFYEWLIAIKSTDRMFSNIGILISTPMLIFLLNKMFLAMNTSTLGNSMIVAFNVLIVLLVVLNSNCSLASIFSKEGRSSYLIKTQPSKYPILILSKLLPNTTFGILSIVATLFVMLYTIPATKMQIILLAAGFGSAYLAHMLYSAELDLMNPQVELYATVGNSDSNPNEMKSTVSAFLVSFLATAAVLLLLIEGEGKVYIKFFGVAFAVLCYRVWMFFAKLRLYYADK